MNFSSLKPIKPIIIGILLGVLVWCVLTIPTIRSYMNGQQVYVSRLHVGQSTQPAGRSVRYLLNLNWVFVVDGTRYTCTQFCLFRGTSVSFKDNDELKQMFEDYKKGLLVQGFYDPSNPNVCWLVARYHEVANGLMIFILLGVAICVCVQIIFGKK